MNNKPNIRASAINNLLETGLGVGGWGGGGGRARLLLPRGLWVDDLFSLCSLDDCYYFLSALWMVDVIS